MDTTVWNSSPMICLKLKHVENLSNQITVIQMLWFLKCFVFVLFLLQLRSLVRPLHLPTPLIIITIIVFSQSFTTRTTWIHHAEYDSLDDDEGSSSTPFVFWIEGRLFYPVTWPVFVVVDRRISLEQLGTETWRMTPFHSNFDLQAW